MNGTVLYALLGKAFGRLRKQSLRGFGLGGRADLDVDGFCVAMGVCDEISIFHVIVALVLCCLAVLDQC
jgi:hypothetical protein